MASFAVNITTNAPDLGKAFRRIVKKQLPFAYAAGLTDTARDARDKFRIDIEDKFTIRSARVKTTVVHTPASKKDFPNSSSSVSIRDEWMARHEIGGRQRTGSGSRFAIPFSHIKRTAGGRIPARFKPRRLRSKKNVFVDEEQEEIRRKQTKRVQGRLRLHLLRKTINLRPRLGFLASVSVTARKKLSPNIEARLRKAVKDEEKRFRRS